MTNTTLKWFADDVSAAKLVIRPVMNSIRAASRAHKPRFIFFIIMYLYLSLVVSVTPEDRRL